MAKKRTFKVGDRVHAGKGEDFDRGRIVSIDRKAHVAQVAWDTLTTTSAPLDILEHENA